ncbi:MAG: M23 family metallopeptidase [Nannocystaceae bacterium]
MLARSPALALASLLAPTLLACSVGADDTGNASATWPTGAGVTVSAGDDSDSTTGDDGSTSAATTLPATTSGTTSGATTTTSTTTTTTTTTGDPCEELGNCSGSETSMGSGDLPDDPCANVNDGLYCGAVLGGLADHQSLYQCMGGKTYSVATCDYGCADNLCKKPPENDDPCDGANSGDGDYCGGTLPGGETDTLYTCINGQTTATKGCANGCQVNAPGVDDKCNVDEDLCQYANGGNGPYCGGSLKPGVADDVLFQCVGGVTQSQQTCADGCVMMPPGEPDVCAPQQGGNECCLDKPPGSLTQSYTACGNGGQHYGIDYGTAVGTPIYAGIAGTVVGMALGYPNCYDNGCSQACWNAFNYVKIKSDCGDPDNANNDLYVYYLHINGVPGGIAMNTHVDQGQLLAYSGNSGCSSGPHIHIETTSVPKGSPAYLNKCTSENPASIYCQ